MTIAITGATGQLGTLVIDHLLERVEPAEVVAVVRNPDKAAGLAARGVAVRTAAYDDPAALDAALAGVDRLLFISGSEIGHRGPQHRNVVEAAARARVGRLLYTSLLNLDGSGAANPVAPDHILTEQVIRDSGLTYTLLRNGWYSENYVPTAQAAAETGELIDGTGEGRIASASRADYAAAAVAALLDDRSGNRIHELGGDTSWTPADLAATITELTGKPVAVRRVAPEAQVDALAAQGVPRGGAEFTAGVDAAIAQGALDTRGDRTLSELIGRPTTPLQDTLAAAFGVAD